MSQFTRTASGQSAYWHFSHRAVFYVEGKSDIHFYEGLIRGIECKVEKLNGDRAGEKIEKEIVNNRAPYVICYDGDYTIFKKKRSSHRQIIRLSRYSFENYFWRKEILNSVASNFAGVQIGSDLIGGEFSRIERNTKTLCRLVEYDITNRKEGLGVEVFPKSIHAITRSSCPIRLCRTKLAARCRSIAKVVKVSYVESHRDSCRQYRLYSKIAQPFHSFNGHFVLSLAKQLIINAVRRETGSSFTCKDAVMSQLLGNVLWRGSLDDDLRKLRNRVRGALCKVIRDKKLGGNS